MEARITSEGHFQIKRKGTFTDQICPVTQESDMACGTWCPLFSEPDNRAFTSIRTCDEVMITNVTRLSLCFGKEYQIKTTCFSDER